VFRDVFDDDSMEIFDDMSAEDVADWDSLQHINLIVGVETEFGIRFATAEISRLKDPGQNVGSFLELIETKLPATGPAT
jgi:acyl carrier protein